MTSAGGHSGHPMSCNISDFLIYLIADASYAKLQKLTELVEQAIIGGVTAVQYRDKSGTQRERLERATRLRELVAEYGVPLIINDHVDVALATGAAGVHVGQDDIPADVVRQLVGDEMTVGVTVRDVAQARRAEHSKADYLGFGPMFPTRTKHDPAPIAGMNKLRSVVNSVGIPVVAIGGITDETAGRILSAGACGVAVAATVLGDEDPRVAAGRLREAVSEKVD